MTTDESHPSVGKEGQQNRTQAEILSNLERLCEEPGFIYSLCLMVARSLWMSSEEVADIDWHSRPNQGELSLLLGLLAKHPIKLDVTLAADDIIEQVGSAIALLEELHHSVAFPQFTTDVEDNLDDQERMSLRLNKYEEWVNSGLGMVEPIFYGGEGAYDFQFLEMASKRYAADEQWIESHTGNSLDTYIEISKEISELTRKRLQSIEPGLTPSDQCIAAFSAMRFQSCDFAKASRQSLENFFKIFSFIPGETNREFRGIGDCNTVHSRPVMSLGDGKYCIPISLDLPKAIYESPFYWMNEDEQYRAISLENRGDATESITQDFLASVFGAEKVFRGVKVKKGRNVVTDIDVLAVSGNKAVIAQCKSKKLTIEAKRGDGRILRRDFTLAVQDAYDQAVKAKRALTEDGYELVDEDGESIPLEAKVDETYILCISGDHYPAVMTQARTHLDSGGDDDHPILISTFDLDVITHYLRDRYEFLYYIRQRSAHAERFVANSEMALLGYHLKHKLFPDEDYDMAMVDDGYTLLVDANFLVARGGWPESESSVRLFHEWKNETFNELMEDIKLAASLDPDQITAEDLLFFLYDLAGKGADQLTGLVRTMKERTIRDGKRHDGRMSLGKGKRGTTFVSFPEPTRYSQFQEFYDFLTVVALTHKYMSQADEWMALASIAGSPVSFDIFGYIKSPWQEDPQMDELVEKSMSPGIPIHLDGTMPSKNRSCPCGSGRKFKRCHGRQNPWQ